MMITGRINHADFLHNTLTPYEKQKPKDAEEIAKKQKIIDICLNCTAKKCKGTCKVK